MVIEILIKNIMKSRQSTQPFPSIMPFPFNSFRNPIDNLQLPLKVMESDNSNKLISRSSV